MPITFPNITQQVSRLLSWHPSAGDNGHASAALEELPLRADLLSVRQLEQHAIELAGQHRLAPRRARDRLIARLVDNEEKLTHTLDLLTAAVEKKFQITPAAEWLLDNFYVIEEQIRTARRHLPRSYSQELPQLAEGPAAGLPRVYGIAMELIAHADGGVDMISLSAFLAAYQTVTPLKLGELWAMPIMLRLALIENLRRMSVGIAVTLADRDSATEWAGRMVQVVERNPSDLILVLADMARADPPLTSAFVAELTRHLHGQSPHFAFALSWLEHRLSERGMQIGQLVQSESQRQAADQISVGNSVTSLRVLSSADWLEFVESQSAVERTLRLDPTGVYPDMAERTRDRYRHVIENVAKRGRMSEADVALATLRLAEAGTIEQPGSRLAHVGYYLVDKGRPALERVAQMRVPVRVRVERSIRRFPLFFYLAGVMVLATSAVIAIAVWTAAYNRPIWMPMVLAVPVLMCAVQLALNIVNWIVTTFVSPLTIPRMDFRTGIPPEHRSMVVIPTMLSSEKGIEELLERVELHYVANREQNLHFGLLTDLKDAPHAEMPNDAALIQQAVQGIEALNEKYRDDRAGIFFLFHRPRRYNAHDDVWMGFERKRGKLQEFTALLRGGPQDCFAELRGDLVVLRQIRYVITLDTDTHLPRDAARQLVGAMAHPLNRPTIDATRRIVVDGHGILQPRVAISLPSASRSWFARLFAGDAGLDPYTRVVSDVYQDLFGEGSFIGKGIYDVDAFNQTCAQFPDNTVLSHDLLEGAYARSALLSDVELYEDQPSRYFADVMRRHRWIRGDWQIARWTMWRVQGSDGALIRNPISLLSRWKIFDNLRRSLVAPAMMLLLILAWLLAWSALGAVATLLILAVVATPPVLMALTDLARKPPDLKWRNHFRAYRPAIALRAGQVLFTLVFLPYEAMISLDAVARTVARVMWSRRRLLEWTTSSDAEHLARTDLRGFFTTMRAAPFTAIALFVLIASLRPENLLVSIPLLVLWLISPGIAWEMSRTIEAPQPRLSAKQTVFLDKLARRTWRYFETFVTEEENWLPPDNYQEHPAARVASRTSPTNIGMAMLANLAAYDFGFSSATQLLTRTQRTLATMGRMEKYHGHLFNWYDTQTLRPLSPLYISTVDSGNLAMHLLVLRQGLIEQIDASILPRRAFDGLHTTAIVLCDVLKAAGASSNNDQQRDALRLVDVFTKELETIPTRLRESVALLQRLALVASDIAAIQFQDDEIAWWTNALSQATVEHRDDVVAFAPWGSLAAAPESLWALDADGLAAHIQELRESLPRLALAPSLRQVSEMTTGLLPLVEQVVAGVRKLGAAPTQEPEILDWLDDLRLSILHAAGRATERIDELHDAARLCLEHANMNFVFLYDESKDLLSIGYNISNHRLDTGYYDLLASEARAASYFAIAQGQLDQEHWFALRRMLTISTGIPALLSWNGSMFEYLMPLLVMPTFENTLLDRTCKAVVKRQMDYARHRGIPWGISESGYNTLDVHLNYQYRGFGVPGLGLKRGLVDDLVVTPYATVLALMVAPEAACKNLERLAADGRLGEYGMYEAIDYTASRVPRGVDGVTIRSFMAHHQGMSLLSLGYVLLDRPMQRRFQADPAFRANELLLQERIPRLTAPVFPHAVEASTSNAAMSKVEESIRVIVDPSAAVPDVHLLSNGSYHVMVNSAGGGYSRWRDLAVTRWREDPTLDCWGNFCYLRDIDSGKYWSTALQPSLKPTRSYEAIFAQAKAEFRRRDDQIETHTEISVSPEDDIELRRIVITNRSNRPRRIELTTYAEVVLASTGQDLTHPAFSNLFVQTQLDVARQAILCTRRPRSPGEQPPWMLHLMTVQGDSPGTASFETDRMKFIGRGRTLSVPAAMDRDTKLTNSEGSVLDPIVSIRRVIVLQPNDAARIDIVTGMAESREGAVGLVEKYRDQRLADRVFELAWTHSQVELRHINATEPDAHTYAKLAGAVIYAGRKFRPDSGILMSNRKSQSGLWGHGISGDLPIVLVRIRDHAKLELIQQIFQAHAYWRIKGLAVDVIVWNEDDSVYRQELHETIMGLIAASPEAAFVDRPGGVFIRRGEQMPEEDRLLLLAVARVVLIDDAGSLRDQVERRAPIETVMSPFKPKGMIGSVQKTPDVARRDLKFFNGLGGFTQDGREYITVLRPGEETPAPWVNVIANPQFGTVISESGGAYTWAENSHEFRLTPWGNDAIGGASGEAFYIRDEESGRVWSPTPKPARGINTYTIRHGFGYTVFEYEEDGIVSELTVYVATDEPVKFSRLKISNQSGRTRRLSITGYCEWVLGELRCKTRMHIGTEIDKSTGAIFARNAYNTEFVGRVAFFGTSETNRSITADRAEFLGRNGSLASPAAMTHARLSGRVGAGLDPCAAIQVPFQIGNGEERQVVFTLGSAHSEQEAHQVIEKTSGLENAQRALESVWHYWSQTLGVIYLETPDAAVNILANGWLPYQILACRMWGRTGFYQSGGAFGFRDQLQDAMALQHAEPRLLREHILRAAARQFSEGDVQHWWHPHSGRGVRSHCSDDYLWLPYATSQYVNATGDTGILDEQVGFLEGRSVHADEEGYYDLPVNSSEAGTLYEHCVRAVKHGLRFGAHGLPLMGTGDWNDGMNLVGAEGKGESVWLAFFLYDVLKRFAAIAERKDDTAFASTCRAEAEELRIRTEASSWDGEWYLRAFFDDGQPLGSASNPECQIDSIAQSWSVLSGAGEPHRARMAMENVDRRLVHRDWQLIQLFDPPFDKSPLNPGYIKGYGPGIRENGGQYTHAAIWTAMAFAALGDTTRLSELISLLNPILHSTTPKSARHYKVEPYVIAADVYAAPPHTGRGGWTWYTGSAGWMYRLIVESLLGLHRETEILRFTPCIPPTWPSLTIHYRYRETFYHVAIQNGGGGRRVRGIAVDGIDQPDKLIRLVDDREPHNVQVDIE